MNPRRPTESLLYNALRSGDHLTNRFRRDHQKNLTKITELFSRHSLLPRHRPSHCTFDQVMAGEDEDQEGGQHIE